MCDFLFQFYGYLSQQQNMMQDYIRTSTYQKAMLQNHEEFRDKVGKLEHINLRCVVHDRSD